MSKEMIRMMKAFSGFGSSLQKIAESELAKLEGKGAPADGGEEMEEVESPYKDEKKGKTKEKEAPKGKTKKEEPKEEPADDMDDLFGEEGEEEISGPTLDDVRKVVKDFATKHGKEKGLKLLGKFKGKGGAAVTSIPDLKPDDYAKVIELAKKHL